MDNFNWEEFKNERVAVVCKSEEEAESFVKECFEHDIKWNQKDNSVTYWGEKYKSIAYSYFGGLTYSSKTYYKGLDYKIIEWNQTKETVKTCTNCIHSNVCEHKKHNSEYRNQMREMIEKWGEGSGFTEDCPSWHEEECKKINFGDWLDLKLEGVKLDEELRKDITKGKIVNYIQEQIKNTEEFNKISEQLAKCIKHISI